MSPTATPPKRRPPRAGQGRPGKRSGGRRRPSRARVRHRRLGALAGVLVIGAVAAVAGGLGSLDEAVREVTLPLRHDDIIRQQAAEKGLDPALIAGIIYEESRFRPRTSPAGAEGLMQLLPGTAEFIAQRSGGTRFELHDLGTPQINISYGAWYLRYLLQQHDGDEELAVAAYNAGETNVSRWVEAAGGPDEFDPDEDIPFAETREYVARVAQRREEYRANYADDLGL